MIRVNRHYAKLTRSYLFTEIARRVSEFQKANPDRAIIKLGIGDVTAPLPVACIRAFERGVAEMGDGDSFRGYGPEQGYRFLREAISEGDFRSRGVEVDPDEIFISDGAKCDTGNFQELFAADISVAIPDPVYPVYLDTNVMAGRAGELSDGRYEGIHYLESTEENGFSPPPPDYGVDLIYLCSPNNPTGATATHEYLSSWVDYAHRMGSLILFDAAYESFIRSDSLPKTIYEIPGSREVAVEFRSFSKTAGFTGTRCAYTIIPRECRVFDETGKPQPLHPLWNRRHSTKFNGVSYPVQRAAEAVFTAEGREEIGRLIDGYMENAALIRREMESLGYRCSGGDNSPYVWLRGEGDSWELFDLILSRAGVVVTPGSGFGRCGEGYIRISAFNSRQNVVEAMNRVTDALG